MTAAARSFLVETDVAVLREQLIAERRTNAELRQRLELPVERGARGTSKLFRLDEFLGAHVLAIGARAASPVNRLEQLIAELTSLLTTAAPATARDFRSMLHELRKLGRRELLAGDRAQLRGATPADVQPQPRRRQRPIGRSTRTEPCR